MRDPVCGKKLTPEQVKGRVTIEACTYSFCSPECQKKFEENPRGYLSDSALGA